MNHGHKRIVDEFLERAFNAFQSLTTELKNEYRLMGTPIEFLEDIADGWFELTDMVLENDILGKSRATQAYFLLEGDGYKFKCDFTMFENSDSYTMYKRHRDGKASKHKHFLPCTNVGQHPVLKTQYWPHTTLEPEIEQEAKPRKPPMKGDDFSELFGRMTNKQVVDFFMKDSRDKMLGCNFSSVIAEWDEPRDLITITAKTAKPAQFVWKWFIPATDYYGGKDKYNRDTKMLKSYRTVLV